MAPPSSLPWPRETCTFPANPRFVLSPVDKRILPDVPLEPSKPMLDPVPICILPLAPMLSPSLVKICTPPLEYRELNPATNDIDPPVPSLNLRASPAPVPASKVMFPPAIVFCVTERTPPSPLPPLSNTLPPTCSAAEVSPALMLTFPPLKYALVKRGSNTESPTVRFRSPPGPEIALPECMIISPPLAIPCLCLPEPATIDKSPPSAAAPLSPPLCT